MKESKELKQTRQKAVSKAVKKALRDYFTGEGAVNRIRSFLGRGLLNSGVGMLAYIAWVSSAIVCGFTLGPDHAVFLAEVHTWAQSTPFDVVSSTIQSYKVNFLLDGAQIGLVSGYAWQLMSIVKPANDMAQAEFHAAQAA